MSVSFHRVIIMPGYMLVIYSILIRYPDITIDDVNTKNYIVSEVLLYMNTFTLLSASFSLIHFLSSHNLRNFY